MNKSQVNEVPYTVKVIEGDITRVESDALITAINSGREWHGGVDRAIKRAAGNHFHIQAARRLPLVDGTAVVARGVGHTSFKNVVFVIDDLEMPLNLIIESGLREASRAGFKSVTLPAIRMGVAAGFVEKTPAETVARIHEGILKFFATNPQTSLRNLTFVLYSDQKSLQQMQQLIS